MTSYRQSMKDTLETMYAIREASLMERDLTPDEEKRREEIAKDLPDDDFKKRYGDKWKSVKMATATKMMKNEKVEVDDEDDDEGDEEEKLTRPGGPMDEAKMSASQIATLKKAYEPMRGKKISMDSGKKLSSIMDKVDDDKQALIQLVKADIPFVSQLAITRLISKHDMKGAEIRKMQEEVELDEKMSPSDQDRLDDLLMAYRWGKSSYGFDDYNDVPNPDDVVKLIRKEFGNKIADQLVKSDDKIKVGYGGPSDRKTPTRITKTGKANKTDLNALKTRLKKKRDWDKIAPKGKLPEEVELDEGKMSQLHQYIKDKKSPEEIAKLMKLDVKTIKALMNSHHPEEVEIEEASAAADARRAMRRDPEMRQRAFSKDDSASDDDQKGASKNIIMQLRKAGNRASMGVEFQDGKKIQIPAKLAMAVQQKYNSLPKPADKEKFQSKIAKSYRDMLNALKEEAVSPAQQAAIAISKKERGEKPKKESILDRIDRKIKENKNG